MIIPAVGGSPEVSISIRRGKTFMTATDYDVKSHVWCHLSGYKCWSSQRAYIISKSWQSYCVAAI